MNLTIPVPDLCRRPPRGWVPGSRRRRRSSSGPAVPISPRPLAPGARWGRRRAAAGPEAGRTPGAAGLPGCSLVEFNSCPAPGRGAPALRSVLAPLGKHVLCVWKSRSKSGSVRDGEVRPMNPPEEEERAGRGQGPDTRGTPGRCGDRMGGAGRLCSAGLCALGARSGIRPRLAAPTRVRKWGS